MSYTPGVVSGNHNTTTINNELDKISLAIKECLRRAENTGNGMEADLDMNDHEILNVSVGTGPKSLVTKEQLDDVAGFDLKDLNQTIGNIEGNLSQAESDIYQLQNGLSLLEQDVENIRPSPRETHLIGIDQPDPAAAPGEFAPDYNASELLDLQAGDYILTYWAETGEEEFWSVEGATPFIWHAQAALGYDLEDKYGQAITYEDFAHRDISRWRVRVVAEVDGAPGSLTLIGSDKKNSTPHYIEKSFFFNGALPEDTLVASFIVSTPLVLTTDNTGECNHGTGNTAVEAAPGLLLKIGSTNILEYRFGDNLGGPVNGLVSVPVGATNLALSPGERCDLYTTGNIGTLGDVSITIPFSEDT